MPLSTSEAFKDAIALFDLGKEIAARRAVLITEAASHGEVDDVDIDLQLGEEFMPKVIEQVRTIRGDFKS